MLLSFKIRSAWANSVSTLLFLLLLGVAGRTDLVHCGEAPYPLERVTQNLIALNRQYQKANPAERPRLLSQLISAATERRRQLAMLIEREPGEVLRNAIPADVRAAMPAGVKAFIEEAVELEGVIELLVEDRDTGSRYFYFLQTTTERLSLYFASKPPEYLTGTRVRVTGLRVGSALLLR